MKKKEHLNGNQTKIPYSKGRGVIVLILLLFVFQIVTFILHKVGQDSEYEKSATFTESEESAKSEKFAKSEETFSITKVASNNLKRPKHLRHSKSYKSNYTLFQFDPNTIPLDSLQMLGFSKAQSLTVIHYRESGARFRKSADFAKVYSVSEEKFRELEPYIVIKENNLRDSKGSHPSHGSDDNSNLNTNTNSKSDFDFDSNTKSGIKTRRYVEINTADSLSLLSVKGVGPYFAHKILKYREKLGGFVDIDQLLEIEKMTPERLEPILSQIEINLFAVRKIDLKTICSEWNRSSDSKQELLKHPYIDKYSVDGIILYARSLSKDSIDRLSSRQLFRQLYANKIITQESYNKLLPYIDEK